MSEPDNEHLKGFGGPQLGQQYYPLEGLQLENPYPFYARARDEEPIFFSERLQAWVVTRYEDVRSVLAQPDIFSSKDVLRPVVSFVPEVFQILATIPLALEEVLRFDGPVQTFYRTALQEVQIGEVTIPEGALLLVVYGSANRDAAQFAHPDRFNLHRYPNHHMAFGYGPHFCVGAPLGRLEGRIALETISQRLPHLRLSSHQALAHLPNLMFRGFAQLQVEW